MMLSVARVPARRAVHRSAAVAGMALLMLAAQAHAGYVGTVIASGLNNPRGLSFGPDGALYIAEAGLAGGAGPSIVVRGDPIVATETGSVTRYFGGAQTRVVTGLASDYNANTKDVTGPNDIVFSPGALARIVVGNGFDPTLRPGLARIGVSLGSIVTPGGVRIDVSAFEQASNPDRGLLDSNPWHAAPIAGGLVVTDAGANALLRVTDAGVVSAIAVFGERALGGPGPTQSVPTGVAVGPDGAFYVGELTGFPFVPGASRIERIAADGTVTDFATGFTMITDLAFGSDGSLYVLEYDDDGLLRPGVAGSLWRIAPDGARSMIFGDGLVQPTGLEIGADGAFYVSNFGGSGGAGQVIRISAIPEPATMALFFAGLAALVSALRRRRPGGRSRPPRATDSRTSPV